jgi:hypothetical protein
MKPRRSSLVLLALSVSWTALAQGPPMRDGNWEVSMKMAGMEASAMKQTQCVTPAMLKDGQGGLPQGLGNDCKVLDYKLAGNTATYKVSCVQPMQMTLTGELKHAGTDAYTGSLTVDAGGTKMAFAIDARRIGDCPK